jgi:hypothetical protein
MSSLDFDLDMQMNNLELEWRLGYEAGISALADIDQHADEYEDPAPSLRERRWFAALTAVRAAQSECDVLREVTEQAEAAWRSARARLEVLERLRDTLGEHRATLVGCLGVRG